MERVREIYGRHPSLVPALIIVLIVIFANILYLTNEVDHSAIYWTSGLGTYTQPSILPGQNVIDPSDGLITQALGHRAALDWLHGSIPWWNQYEGVGAPLAGEMESAALFLPFVLLLALPNGLLYLLVVLEVVCALSTFFLARRLRLSMSAASIAGIAFGLNGTYAWLAHSAVFPIAFLPMALLGVERAADASRGKSWGGWGLLGIAIGFAILAGFPETLYWDSVFITAWTLMRAWTLRHSNWVGFGARSIVGALSGAAVAAPLIVAFADYSKAWIHPYVASSDMFGWGPRPELSTYVLPYVVGPIGALSSFDHSNTISAIWNEVGGYFGAAIAFLAILGVFGRKGRALRLLCAVWVVLAVTRNAGVWLSTHLFSLLPLNGIVNFSRFGFPAVELAMVILAAFAIDDLVSGSARRWQIVTATGLALGVIVVSFGLSERLLSEIGGAGNFDEWFWASFGWALLIVLVIVTSALWLKGRLRISAISAAVVVDVLAMFVVPQLSSPRNAGLDTRPVSYLQRHLGGTRFVTLGPITPEYGAYYGISSVNVFDAPVPLLWSEYLLNKLDPNSDAFAFTGSDFWQGPGPSVFEQFAHHLAAFEAIGARYLVTFAPGPPAAPALPGAVRVFDDGQVSIYRLPTGRPMFSIHAGQCNLNPRGFSNVIATCASNAVLVRSELDMAGWVATVNGHTVPIRLSDGLVEEISLPAGRSRVSFIFRPPGMGIGTLGLGLGAATILLSASPLGRLRRKRKANVQTTC